MVCDESGKILIFLLIEEWGFHIRGVRWLKLNLLGFAKFKFLSRLITLSEILIKGIEKSSFSCCFI